MMYVKNVTNKSTEESKEIASSTVYVDKTAPNYILEAEDLLTSNLRI